MDAGAAEVAWPKDFMLEVKMKPSVGSLTGVISFAASENKMLSLQAEQGPLQDQGRAELQN